MDTNSTPCSLLLSTIFVIPFLLSHSAAQIAGCDAVNCPVNEYSNSICPVGNITAQAIGITNFSIPVTDQALTWTITTESLKNDQNTFERDFFLGSPANLDLKARASSDTQLCAIFFNGVATRVMFPGTDPEYDQGTCNDALTAACTNDLRSQAQSFQWRNLTGASLNGGSSFCTQLGDSLRKDAPQSCTVASDHQWTDVQVRPLTGSNLPSPLQTGNCTPTTGKGYALTQIESFQINAPSLNITDLQPILLGVTPILTAMWDPNNGSVVSTDLSCLKTVGSKANSTSPGGQHTGGAAKIGTSVGFSTGLMGIMWILSWVYAF